MMAIGFPGGSDSEESACNAGDPDSISGSERSPGEGNGNPLQYLAWRVPWPEKPGRLQSMGSQSQTRLSDEDTHTHTHPMMAMRVRNSGADCVLLAQGFCDFAISIVAGESTSKMTDSHGAGC